MSNTRRPEPAVAFQSIPDEVFVGSLTGMLTGEELVAFWHVSRRYRTVLDGKQSRFFFEKRLQKYTGTVKQILNENSDGASEEKKDENGRRVDPAGYQPLEDIRVEKPGEIKKEATDSEQPSSVSTSLTTPLLPNEVDSANKKEAKKDELLLEHFSNREIIQLLALAENYEKIKSAREKIETNSNLPPRTGSYPDDYPYLGICSRIAYVMGVMFMFCLPERCTKRDTLNKSLLALVAGMTICLVPAIDLFIKDKDYGWAAGIGGFYVTASTAACYRFFRNRRLYRETEQLQASEDMLLKNARKIAKKP